jgi:prepilin-type N-terminal cleavage/methylation domain-containing protein
MHHSSGFSLLEILVAIGIVALVGTVGVANFAKPNQSVKFQEEVKLIFDTLATARVNAIAGKKCGADMATSWGFSLGPNTFTLECNGAEAQSFPIAFSSSSLEFEGDEMDTDTIVHINFAPESAQVTITNNADEKKTTVRAVLSGLVPADVRTLCFGSIAGFPEMLKGDISCP